MAELCIHVKPSKAQRLYEHLSVEHPSLKGHMRIKV